MYMNQKIFLIDIFSKGGGWVVLLYLFFLSVVGSANVKNPFFPLARDDSAAFELLLTTNR